MPQTLLLADDSVTIQRVIELTFADEDIRVVAVSDGDQAIAALDKTPPDIVLADVGMPGRSGYDVARHIKETPRFAHIPVVLLTGAFEPIDQAKASTIGCDGVLAKPFEPHLVISRVKELLAKQKPGATSKDAQAGPAPAKASSWPPAPAGDRPAAGSAAKTGPGGDYFDRLDQAFASLNAEPPSSKSTTTVDRETEWFPARPPTGQGSKPADLPLSYPSPKADFGRSSAAGPPAPPAAARPDTSQASRPATPPTSATATAPLPPLADAFAALLAAERGSPAASSGAPAWPAAAASSPGVASEELIEQATKRVLERLSDRVVRETVSEIVSRIAERLVREEIERIKNAMK